MGFGRPRSILRIVLVDVHSCPFGLSPPGVINCVCVCVCTYSLDSHAFHHCDLIPNQTVTTQALSTLSLVFLVSPRPSEAPFPAVAFVLPLAKIGSVSVRVVALTLCTSDWLGSLASGSGGVSFFWRVCQQLWLR